MVHSFLTRLFFAFIRVLLRLRYRIRIEGKELLEPSEGKKRGALLLPNHPAHIDPLILAAYLWRIRPFRPLIVEYTYRVPFLNFFFTKLVNAISIPEFEKASNSYKLMRAERSKTACLNAIHEGESLLIYPAGRLKRTAEERVGGSSLTHELIRQLPETPIFLIRTTGLWGSMFGWGITGQRPSMRESAFRGMKMILKNGIFFVPKREISIKIERAPQELIQASSRQQCNRILEEWYNYLPHAPGQVGEPLRLVSYSFWKQDFPEVRYRRPYHEADIDNVPIAVRRRVIGEVARLSGRKASDIRPELHLFTDLGLDSLDIAELVTAVEPVEQGRKSADWELDLLTVGAVMALAAGFGAHSDEEGAERPPMAPPKGWVEKKSRPHPQPGEGKTLLEAILDQCDRMGNHAAIADQRVGVFSYRRVKERALLLAQAFQKLPGKEIGVLLPSSVVADLVILACWMAGKIPVMLNWTVGPAALQHAVDLTSFQCVITALSFADNLDGVDLHPIQEKFFPLEDLKGLLGWKELLKAKYWKHLRRTSLLKRLRLQHLHPDSPAVILFTSGTEALPKGVPLSHKNILINQRAGGEVLEYRKGDVLLSILPPFHSLGFSITTLFPLVMGFRAVYSPDPTNASALLSLFPAYHPTIICSAPTFLKGLFHRGTPEELSHLRLIVSGAEKAPQDLIQQIAALGEGHEFLEGYGITECSPILTLNRPGETHQGVGAPLPGVTLKIVDPETLHSLPEGARGLILARGENVFSGYLGEKPTDPFVEVEGECWFSTGDLGYFDSHGSLILSGRLKRFIKIGGEMISLPAIEEALAECARSEGWPTSTAGCHLAVIPHEEEGKRPELLLYSDCYIPLEEANAALRSRGFGPLSRLSATYEVAEIPLMGSGKVDYRTLQEEHQKVSRA